MGELVIRDVDEAVLIELADRASSLGHDDAGAVARALIEAGLHGPMGADGSSQVDRRSRDAVLRDLAALRMTAARPAAVGAVALIREDRDMR